MISNFLSSSQAKKMKRHHDSSLPLINIILSCMYTFFMLKFCMYECFYVASCIIQHNCIIKAHLKNRNVSFVKFSNISACSCNSHCHSSVQSYALSALKKIWILNSFHFIMFPMRWRKMSNIDSALKHCAWMGVVLICMHLRYNSKLMKIIIMLPIIKLKTLKFSVCGLPGGWLGWICTLDGLASLLRKLYILAKIVGHFIGKLSAIAIASCIRVFYCISFIM